MNSSILKSKIEETLESKSLVKNYCRLNKILFFLFTENMEKRRHQNRTKI